MHLTFAQQGSILMRPTLSKLNFDKLAACFGNCGASATYVVCAVTLKTACTHRKSRSASTCCIFTHGTAQHLCCGFEYCSTGAPRDTRSLLVLLVCMLKVIDNISSFACVGETALKDVDVQTEHHSALCNRLRRIRLPTAALLKMGCDRRISQVSASQQD